MRVIGGRQDLPGFREEKYNATFKTWYPNVDLVCIAEAGHYPMQDASKLLVALVKAFLHAHRNDRY